jgi:glyoxylase-like metal-dependent hydrolase (beta-lactamase superfamily II)
MKKICFLLCGFVLATSFLLAQMDLEKVQIETVNLTDTIYILKGAGGNMCASIGPDGVLLIDTEYAPLYQKIKDALHKLGGNKIKYVINTHWHGDHTSGNINFAADAPIIAHKNVRETMLHPKPRKGKAAEPANEAALPIITYDSEMTIYINDEDVKLIRIPPGHTDGDTVVYFPKSNVVHMGDLFFNGTFPYIDFENGGNVLAYTENVKSILDNLADNIKIIPGHGPLATKKDFQTFYNMLVETTAYVKAKIDAGLSVEEISKSGLPEKWKSWGEGFLKPEMWIDFICKSYGYQK